MGLLLVGLLLLVLAAPAGAQGTGFGPVAEGRQGFWIGGGFGQGYTDLSCAICGGTQAGGGPSAGLRMGGTVSRQFLLGGEVTGWRKGGELTQTVLTGTLIGTWYPSVEHGWLVRLGVGYTRYRATEGNEALNAWLPTLQVSGAYEMRVSPTVSLAPFVGVSASALGAMNLEDTRNGGFSAERVADDVRVLVLKAGIGITRH